MSVSPNGVIYQTINPQAQGVPLIVVHETVKMRALLRDKAPDDCRIIVLFSQGTDGSTDLCKSVNELASYYIAALDSLAIAPPYYLAGFSMGAMVAFEMAQQLSSQGVAPLHLTMLAPACGTIKSASLFRAHNKRVRSAMVSDTAAATSNKNGLRYGLTYGRRWLGLFIHIYKMYWHMRYLVWRGRPLPKHLVWYNLTRVYIDTAYRYLKHDYFGPTTLVYERDTANHIWLPYLKGDTTVFADVDCDHYQVVEAEHAKIWLDRIFVRA